MTIDEAYNTCFGNPYIVPIDEHEEAKRIIRDVMEEVKQYRELGTVEELRIAKEKQIPKKPILANNMMTKDKFLMCPCCKFRFPDSLVFLKTGCWNCGQKLDWGNEE